MKKIKSLNNYQKGILILMLVMALVFSVLYPRIISRVGYRYHDAILVQTQENDKTIFLGKIKGEQARFIISNHTVEFQYGEKSYGQYRLQEDPTAIPKMDELADRMTGIEISHGETMLFRGGVLDLGDSYWLLYNEDGTLADSGFSAVTTDGLEIDGEGIVIDKMEPSISIIYDLLNNPELTHKGDILGWFTAMFLCCINALSILYADQLFRWRLAFWIRDVENAEPSEVEVASRYIGWMLMTIGALVCFVLGLQ